MPRVTVIIPTFNLASVLPYAIGSVLRQTLADFELWVIGDGCTDNSEAVVRQFSDPRVHWHNLPQNHGFQSWPNNEGLRRAQGRWIAHLGHDDLWLPHHLETLVEVAERGAEVVFGVTELVGPSGRRTFTPGNAAGYRPGEWLPPTGLLFAREMIQKVGGWRFYQELKTDPEVDLLMRMHAAGARFQFVPRLTAIKFPAESRKNCYRENRGMEQAEWTRRLQEETDFETRELARMLVESQIGGVALLKQKCAEKISHWRHRLEVACLGYERAVFRRRRRFKGLPATPGSP